MIGRQWGMSFAVAAAVFAAACNGCQPTPVPGPVPPAPSGVPAPVVADAGDACAHACEAADSLCDRPAVTAGDCAALCARGMANLSGPSATPRCLAAEIMCGSKEWCTK